MSDGDFRRDVRQAFEEMTGMPGPEFGSQVRLAVRTADNGPGQRMHWAVAAAAAAIAVAVVGTLLARGLGGPHQVPIGPGPAGTPSPAVSAAPTVAPSTAPSASPQAVYECGDTSTTLLSGAPYPALVVNAVRAGKGAGYDRFVIEYTGTLTGFSIKRTPTATFTQDASGRQVALDGTAGLLIVLTGDSVQVTSQSDLKPAYSQLREASALGAFEGRISWGLGLARPGCYHVLQLVNPSRLVIDVQN